MNPLKEIKRLLKKAMQGESKVYPAMQARREQYRNAIRAKQADK